MPQDSRTTGFQPTWQPDNLFAGTAGYYARYRPGYPDAVFHLLVEKYRLTAASRVLDLGCGTGQAALKIAPYVGQVIAVDPQGEMLDEGRRAAAAAGIANIDWLKGESGDLQELAGQFKPVNLTVIARAFHWMDQPRTLRDLYPLTLPGGGVAVIADDGPTDHASAIPWKSVIRDAVRRWLGEVRKAGTQGTFAPPLRSFEQFLHQPPFTGFEHAVFTVVRRWTVDEIIGYVYSTSLASPPVLGDKRGPFEADLRQSLLALEPSGQFTENAAVQVMTVRKES